MYLFFRDLAIILIGGCFWPDCPQTQGTPSGGRDHRRFADRPSLLGVVQLSDTISVFAEIGVILLMFSTGLGTNLKQLMKAGPIATLVACVGVFVPLVGGTLLYGAFYGLGAIGSPEFYKALFIGTIMTATSVSITVATLQELGQLKGFLGTTIVSAAVIDDVIGIVVLTCVLGAGSGEEGGTSIGQVLINTVLFFVVAVIVGFVLYKAMTWLDNRNPHTQRITIASLGFCFAMAYIAEQYFGIADITGAYIAGIVLCNIHDAPYVERRVEISNYMMFAPVFFCFHRPQNRYQRPDSRYPAVLCLLCHCGTYHQDHWLRSCSKDLQVQLGRFPQGWRWHDDPRRGCFDCGTKGPCSRHGGRCLLYRCYSADHRIFCYHSACSEDAVCQASF